MAQRLPAKHFIKGDDLKFKSKFNSESRRKEVMYQKTQKKLALKRLPQPHS